MAPWSLIVVGLGRAGSQYAEADAALGIHRSHIGAALATGAYRVAGIVDPDPARAEAARTFWGAALADAAARRDLLDVAGPVDVVALASPPAGRLEAIKAALALRPKVILCEKPLADTAEEAEAIADACAVAGVPLRVNFHRSVDPAHAALGVEAHGAPTYASARIGGGLVNYGSHVVDLLLGWFGDVRAVRAMGSEDDGLTARLEMAAGFHCDLVSLPRGAYDVFEADFLFSDRRLTLANGGVEKIWHRPVEGLHYPGYVQLEARAETPSLVGGLDALYRSIADHLAADATGSGAEIIGCDGRRAARNARILDAVRRAAATGETVEP